MVGHQFLQINPHRRAINHTPFTFDHHAIRAMRATKYKRCKRIMAAGETKFV